MHSAFQLILLLSAFIVSGQELQEKHQRAKIMYAQNGDLQRLSELDIPVEHGIHKKGYYIISDFSVSEIQRARTAGFNVSVLIDDAKEYFLQQNRNHPQKSINPDCAGGSGEYQTPSNFHFGSMGGYLTYQELLDELDEMRTQYPNLISLKQNIGNFLTEGTPDNSVSPSIGGNGIKWVKISDNPGSTSEGEPKILYTALHHAREPASLSQLVFFMWYLLENYDSDPEIAGILNNTELYFVPVVNPDGYLYNQKTDPNGGGFWRKNRKNTYGTDLNRNYDYFINGDPANNVWGGQGASGNTGSSTYHGPTPFSEVETRAIKWFVEQHDFVMAFNNHTSGDLLLFPYGYEENIPTPEHVLFEGISAELVSQNGFKNMISSQLYPAAGDSDDFMYGTVNTHDKIYAFTPEIGSQFWPPANEIESICKGMMYLNVTAAKMVNNYAKVTDKAPLYTGASGTINAAFNLKRFGLTGSGNFTVSLHPVSTNINGVGAAVSFSGMEILEAENGVISYSLEAGTAAGDDVIYDLVVNNGSYNSSIRVYKKFGDLIPIFEDAANSVTQNFNNNGWSTTSATFVSPSSSITDSPSGNYPNNTNETITLSDPVDLSTAVGASLSFYAKWNIENNFDYVQVEISANNGGNWQPQCGKYTNPGSHNSEQPTGEPLYDGLQQFWVKEEIDLSAYLGETILVRFQLRSDGSQREDGFYFDDLTISTVETTVLSDSDSSANNFVIYPNPVNDKIYIMTPLSRFNAALYTLQGRLLLTSEGLSGASEIDVSGFSGGMYFLKLTSEEKTQIIKILKE
jgi:carboxypeptidase T